jgi:hypothetical protein
MSDIGARCSALEASICKHLPRAHEVMFCAAGEWVQTTVWWAQCETAQLLLRDRKSRAESTPAAPRKAPDPTLSSSSSSNPTPEQ